MDKLWTLAAMSLRIICAVALLSLAFAHRPPQMAAVVLETASLMLPDGKFADLCIGEAGMEHPAAAVVLCEACMLAGAIVLPLPDDGAWLITGLASLENALRERKGELAFLAIDRARSRGPPATS